MYLQYIAQCFIRKQTPQDHMHFFYNILYNYKVILLTYFQLCQTDDVGDRNEREKCPAEKPHIILPIEGKCQSRADLCGRMQRASVPQRVTACMLWDGEWTCIML